MIDLGPVETIGNDQNDVMIFRMGHSELPKVSLLIYLIVVLEMVAAEIENQDILVWNL